MRSNELEGTLSTSGRLEGQLSIGGGGTKNYEELANKPQINGVELSGNKTAEDLGFSDVSMTGDYDDIKNKPTIPAPQVNADWNAVEGVEEILNKPELYTKSEVNTLIALTVESLLPTDSASGAVATFSTARAKPLINIDVDETATKVYQRGANLWDEQWEVGTYNTNTGAKSSSTTRKRSKDLFPIPNAVGASLYITPIDSGGNGLSFLFYDKNKQFKNGYYRGSTAGGFAFVIQEDWYYMAISPNENYGTTYNNDISIRIDNNYSYVAYNPASDDYDVSETDDITTFEGLNNIFTDSGNIEVDFKDGIQHYIDKKIAETQALIL